ncbi:MAG: type I pantothenate kinase [Actinomycetia bacterium]|nr:type I pantothenate kinase [Actinomycetes bacterium]MCP3912077.1 type I pantothenate kinase [Actinomycetes bacterium]
MSPALPTDRSPFLRFTADQWAQLRASTPMTLTEDDLEQLRGINEEVSMQDVARIYLPTSRLLNLYVGAIQDLYRATDTFLGKLPAKVPYVIGLAGSVAVGKSTTSRILKALLARWPNHPRVDLITTDGFLYPNAVLAERGLMERKGFPESYDVKGLIDCVAQIKSGEPRIEVPLYSHLVYDVLPDDYKVIEEPDIVIVEGINVLQTSASSSTSNNNSMFVSDFFDFKIYVDAEEGDVREWYVQRFFALREKAFSDPRSFFTRYAELDDDHARQTAEGIWDAINGPNLSNNILPTRDRADLILEKAADHSVSAVRLRRL